MTKEQLLDEIRFNIRVDEEGETIFRAGISSLAIDTYCTSQTQVKDERIADLEKELERRTELLRDTYNDYNDRKYMLLDIRLNTKQREDMWQQFKFENNL